MRLDAASLRNVLQASAARVVGATVSLLCAVVAAPAGHAAQAVGSGDCRVRLLEPGDAGELPGKYAGAIAVPTATHRMVVEEALALMPPLTCAAVRRAVFVRGIAGHDGEEGWVHPDDPDLVNINLDTVDPARAGAAEFGAYFLVKTMQAFLHEATHAADYLLHAHGAKAGSLGGVEGAEHYRSKLFARTPDPDDWPAASQRLAREIVKNARLGGSLRAEWVRVQRGFAMRKLGGDYWGLRGPGETDDGAKLARDGFASRYGATRAGEDIAEFAAWMLAAPLMVRDWGGRTMPSRAIDDHACRAMRAHDKSSVPGRLALLFTKANLLLSAGLVTEQAYERCVGKLRLREPGACVFAWEFVGDPADDNVRLRRNFAADVSASIGKHPQLEQYVFQLQATGSGQFAGKEHPATVKLRVALAPAGRDLETVSWPRGLYDLGEIGNRFSVEVPSAPAATFVATHGFLLVGHASSRRIDGSIFLQTAIRPQAPVPVPQTGLPMRFTFSIQR